MYKFTKSSALIAFLLITLIGTLGLTQSCNQAVTIVSHSLLSVGGKVKKRTTVCVSVQAGIEVCVNDVRISCPLTSLLTPNLKPSRLVCRAKAWSSSVTRASSGAWSVTSGACSPGTGAVGLCDPGPYYLSWKPECTWYELSEIVSLDVYSPCTTTVTGRWLRTQVEPNPISWITNTSDCLSSASSNPSGLLSHEFDRKGGYVGSFQGSSSCSFDGPACTPRVTGTSPETTGQTFEEGKCESGKVKGRLRQADFCFDSGDTEVTQKVDDCEIVGLEVSSSDCRKVTITHKSSCNLLCLSNCTGDVGLPPSSSTTIDLSTQGVCQVEVMSQSKTVTKIFNSVNCEDTTVNAGNRSTSSTSGGQASSGFLPWNPLRGLGMSDLVSDIVLIAVIVFVLLLVLYIVKYCLSRS